MDKTRIFRLGFQVLPRLPHAFLQYLAVAGGYILWAVAGGMRARVRTNLSNIPSLAADPERLDRAVRGAFVSLVLNYLDLLVPPTPAEMANFEEISPIEDPELFAEARALGKGCIVLSVHSAGFEWGRWRLPARFDGTFLGPMENVNPPEFYDLLADERSRSGIRFLPVTSGETLRECITGLRQGANVLLALDRDVLHSGVVMPFFGKPARIPTGGISLARMTGAPILLVFAWRDGVQRYVGKVTWPQVVIGSETRGEDAVRAALEPLVRVMEAQIEAHPDQWLAAFSDDIWVSESDASSVARDPAISTNRA